MEVPTHRGINNFAWEASLVT